MQARLIEGYGSGSGKQPGLVKQVAGGYRAYPDIISDIVGLLGQVRAGAGC